MDKNKELIEQLKKDYSYPDPTDPDFQSRIYQKREFYSNRIPYREKLDKYEDIKAYRDEVCGGHFELYGQQTFLSNYMNPNTPYTGLLIFHGVGTGKCILPDTTININNYKETIETIWNKSINKHQNSYFDGEGEWVQPYDKLNVISISNDGNLTRGNVKLVYKQKINEIIKLIKFKNGLQIGITKIHKLLTTNSWVNDLHIGDHICSLLENQIDIEYLEIVSIEEIQYDNYVYDLDIPEHHNYVANNIFCHNTCAAISIAENFKNIVKKYDTKIYVLTSGPLIKEVWKDQLIKCTKETYLKEILNTIGYVDEFELEKAKKMAINLALQYYKIMSYRSFYKKVLGEKIKDETIVTENQKIKVSYRKTEEGEIERDISIDKIESLDNTLLIVDEAHNLTGNDYGMALKKIINNSKNLRILLLTATPMKNLADDIIDLLNFIRPQNDPIERDKIFTQEKNHLMNFKENGLEYLQNMASGYISYFRGANPLTFAIQVDQGIISEGLLFTKVIKCAMEPLQYETYSANDKHLEDTLDRKSEAVANFVFPGLSEKKDKIIGYFSKDGIDIIINQLKNYPEILLKKINDAFFEGKIKNLKEIMYETNEHNITGLILKKEYIKSFSTKFYTILTNLEELIVGKKGPKTAFVYSNLVKVGIDLFSEMLLQNGYLEYDENENYPVSNNTVCYYCGKKFIEHTDDELHTFHPATFIVVTGKSEESADALPEQKKKILDDIFNKIENKEGKYIKFLLGSMVMNEGITLENIGEVHIIDVHYNFGRVHQVIGRAIRQCKHYKTISDENKYPEVNVYKYVVQSNTGLSTEEELYRKAELKYLLVKKVERALKEISIDCPNNYNGNVFPEELEKYKNCRSPDDNTSNKIMCPAICDFTTCEYKCHDKKLNLQYYDKDRKLYKKIQKNELDYTTFSKELARSEIERAKEKIKELYRFKYVYTLDELLNITKQSYVGEKKELFDDFFVFKSIDELIPITENDFNNFKDTIYDKFNVPGYLIYRKNFYIFQPFDQNEDVPMYYRSTYNKEILNELTLSNYLHGMNLYKIIKEETSEKTSNIKPIGQYDFESVKEYYDNRDEYDFVGIIDRQTRKKFEELDIHDVFKIRPKRDKILIKKRGTGIPSIKGAVCGTIGTKEQLIEQARKINVVGYNDEDVRSIICDAIKNRLLFLEKYSTGKDKMTYIIIPKNHPIHQFPFNLEDRILYITRNIKELIPIDLNITQNKETNGIFNDKREKKLAKYVLSIKHDNKLDQYKTILKNSGFEKIDNNWIMIVE